MTIKQLNIHTISVFLNIFVKLMKLDVNILAIHIPQNNLIYKSQKILVVSFKTQTAASENLEACKVA